MTNVFTGWSVAIHIVDSKPPWPEYSELKVFLKPTDRSPDHRRTSDLEESLLDQGMFGSADPELLALRVRYTVPHKDGTMRIDIPPEFAPVTPEDAVLCERLVLTERGRHEAEAV